MGYHWVSYPDVTPQLSEDLGLWTEFDDQGSAEGWLTQTFAELSEAGVAEVSLYEGDRLIYGPMSLSE